MRGVISALHCYRYVPNATFNRLQMIVIGAEVDVEIGKDDLSWLLLRAS
jgi:hypothetical protein